MSISFLRVDDRMIHGQTVTRWSLEYPCDGLIAVNDKAATNPALKAAYKSASSKKTFVWTYEDWKKKCQKVLDSKDRYFLITKDAIMMEKILVEDGFVPSDIKKVIIGPCNDRDGATKLGNNQSITQPEADALEKINQEGYEIEFALVKEASIGSWEKFRGQFGYK
ncbi:MAG: PTS sugar transporter subunit IIB [Anaerostipes sp.]|jgi:mannose/fructose/N-acetylgalactosamine-specific phosphotransferase system component IIB|nr:PTS sugar transporter subunit IIB [Anaerostipes sp.]